MAEHLPNPLPRREVTGMHPAPFYIIGIGGGGAMGYSTAQLATPLVLPAAAKERELLYIQAEAVQASIQDEKMQGKLAELAPSLVPDYDKVKSDQTIAEMQTRLDHLEQRQETVSHDIHVLEGTCALAGVAAVVGLQVIWNGWQRRKHAAKANSASKVIS